MSVLIVGGAGYIGSHTTRYFQEKNEEIVVVDNLSSGHLESIDCNFFYQVDIRDSAKMDQIFLEHRIDSVIHFAANSTISESLKDPIQYYQNNVAGSITLLEIMMRRNVKKIIFSSSAAVYGEPRNTPIYESDKTKPINPYGESKLIIEGLLRWLEQAYGLKYVSLRYFNASGAHPSGAIGEDHKLETHLIPLILQVPLGKRDCFYIYGDDYPTKDGSCIRDFIHVQDLAVAHYKSFEYLKFSNSSEVLNIGNGSGHSVKEVLETAREVTGHPIPTVIKSRRPGDPTILIASAEKAKEVLNWEPKYASLKEIIYDAWQWHRKHPDGY